MRKKQSSHNSVETKLEAVRQVLENKRPVAEVANELDLHRDTVNRWVNSFKDNGEKGLVNPRSISQPSQSKDITLSPSLFLLVSSPTPGIRYYNEKRIQHRMGFVSPKMYDLNYQNAS